MSLAAKVSPTARNRNTKAAASGGGRGAPVKERADIHQHPVGDQLDDVRRQMVQGGRCGLRRHGAASSRAV